MNSEENSRLPSARRNTPPGPTSVAARVRRSAWRPRTWLSRARREETEQEQVWQSRLAECWSWSEQDC